MILITWNVEKYNFEKIEKIFTNKKFSDLKIFWKKNWKIEKLSPIHVT